MINPVFLQVGKLSIRWYGICTALGLLAGYFLQLCRAKRYSFTKDMVADLTFFCMLGGVVGARLAYVLRFWQQEFAGGNPLRVFMVWEGGLVFQGGFIVAALVGMALVKLRKWNLANTADLIAPALPLAHAIGRIGCLINGCCFGFLYEGPFAVHYPVDGNSVLYIQQQQGLLPPEATQCGGTFPVAGLEALCNVLICLLLLFLEKKKILEGRRFLLYILLYSTIRFMLEFARGDYLSRPFGLTNAQVTCLWIIPLTAFTWIALHFWNKQKTQPAK
jgi:phosphatidylglycerol:prolipoprotein diacylglycerol transferase